jgi:hypothetical protein
LLQERVGQVIAAHLEEAWIRTERNGRRWVKTEGDGRGRAGTGWKRRGRTGMD